MNWRIHDPGPHESEVVVRSATVLSSVVGVLQTFWAAVEGRSTLRMVPLCLGHLYSHGQTF